MELSEKEIENFIYDDLVFYNGENLASRGLELQCFKGGRRYRWHKQLQLSPYGIADIVGFYRIKGGIGVEIIELKAVPIECNDFEQVFRYAKGIETYLQNTFTRPNVNINCHLIGNGYKNGRYIQNQSYCSVTEYRYDLEGVSFKTHGPASAWYVTEGGYQSFRSPYKKR